MTENGQPSPQLDPAAERRWVRGCLLALLVVLAVWALLALAAWRLWILLT